MLSQTDVYEVLVQHLPAHVDIVFVGLDDYIATAKKNPFIQRQIAVGIYNDQNIREDFLSAACSYVLADRLEVCLDLINAHIEGVQPRLVQAYLRNLAAHEAHHFHEKNTPDDALAHAHNELDCIETVRREYPDLDAMNQEFEAQSPVYQRVYARIQALQRR